MRVRRKQVKTRRQASSGIPKKHVHFTAPGYIKERLKLDAQKKGVTLAKYILAIIRSKPEPDEMYLR